MVALPGLLVLVEATAWAFGHPILPFLESSTGPWCHRDPSRTLTLGQTLLPVCARCTGLYGGLVAGAGLGLVLPKRAERLLAVTAGCLLPALVALLAAFAEAAGLIHTGNATRIVLGLLLTVGPTAWMMVGAHVLADAF